MYGGAERRLPVLRIAFENSDKTWLYLDSHTGGIELSSSRAQRTGRWLFNFLHSWDRSEEYTSELQSLMRISYAVFCLKKKKKKQSAKQSKPQIQNQSSIQK